jgi:DNA-binding transcriptional ArsR family regulator
MISDDKLGFDALNSALKAAGEETRLRVIALLAEAELTVSDLTDILRQSQPRISRHLRLLAEAGLVERFREGPGPSSVLPSMVARRRRSRADRSAQSSRPDNLA